MKIISYALFGNDKFYHKGLERNINIAKKLFKGWRVRVYCCEELKNKAFIKKLLTRKNVDLIFKKQTYNYEPLLWRILPMEEGHDCVIVRDIDTKLFKRDKRLVDNWLRRSEKFHICRDAPLSQVIPGGIWGGKKSKLKIKVYWDIWRKDFRKKNPNKNLWDQGFLKQYVYPQMRNDLIVYSDYLKLNGEKVISLGRREKYKGFTVSIGMYLKEDLKSSSLKKGNSNRLNLFNQVQEDMIKYKNQTLLLRPKYLYINSFFNTLYLFIDFMFLLLQNIFVNNNALKYLKEQFSTKILKRKRKTGIIIYK